MRVVGGSWRGRRLTAPRGAVTRPTSDLVREAIFDVLGPLLAARPAPARGGRVAAAESRSGPAAAEPGAHPDAAGPPDGPVTAGPLEGLAVLDLFAGSGALGIEALSRGAATCTFVERAPIAVRALRDNLARVQVRTGAVRVRCDDYRRALKADARGARLYNLVLVDAPYALYPKVEPELAVRLTAVLAPGAVVVVETARGQAVDLPLAQASVKLYGDTRVTFCSEV
jgi:16S rRNA (guanine966-N2)-methyltransferase